MDKPHTKTAVNLGYRVAHGVCDLFDDWLNAGVEPAPIRHIPASVFKLSDAENQAIDFEERSMFTRGVTRGCKMLGAKTADEAHHMIDAAAVAGSVLRLAWVIIGHYRHAFKVSPRFEKQRAANRAKLAALKAGGKAPGVLGRDPFGDISSPAHAGATA